MKKKNKKQIVFVVAGDNGKDRCIIAVTFSRKRANELAVDAVADTGIDFTGVVVTKHEIID